MRRINQNTVPPSSEKLTQALKDLEEYNPKLANKFLLLIKNDEKKAKKLSKIFIPMIRAKHLPEFLFDIFCANQDKAKNIFHGYAALLFEGYVSPPFTTPPFCQLRKDVDLDVIHKYDEIVSQNLDLAIQISTTLELLSRDYGDKQDKLYFHLFGQRPQILAKTLQLEKKMNALYETLGFLFECFSKHSSTQTPAQVLSLERLFYTPTRFHLSELGNTLGPFLLAPHLTKLQSFANDVDPAKLKLKIHYRSRFETTYNLLLLSLFAKDDKTALKLIKQLQTDDCAIFHEADRLVGMIWLDLMSKYEACNGHRLKYRDFIDNEENYDLRKVAEEFTYCSAEFSDYLKAKKIGGGYKPHGFKSSFYYSTTIIYGIGLAIVLNGRIEILAELLKNDSLHPMDKIYLQYILPLMLSFNFHEDRFTRFRRQVNINKQHHDVLAYLERLSEILSRGGPITDTDIHQLRDSYKAFSNYFLLLVNPTEFSSAQEVKIGNFKDKKIEKVLPSEQNARTYISIGTECNLELIPSNFFAVLNAIQGYRPYEFAKQTEIVKQDNLQIEKQFNDLHLELLSMVVGFTLKMPKKSYSIMMSRLGALLRATFSSEDLKGLLLPLSPSEIEFFDRIYTTAGKAELCSEIQVHHLWELPGIRKRLANACFKLPYFQLKAHLSEYGILVFENESSSITEKVLHEGDHDHHPKYFVTNYNDLKKCNFPRYQIIVKSWQRMNGNLLECPSGLPDHYVPVARLIGNHLETILHPRQIMIVRNSNRQEHFIPTAIVNKKEVSGSYLYFWQSPQQKKSMLHTPVIVTGGCRFGGTLVGIVKNGYDERQIVLTDPDVTFEDGDRLIDVKCTATEHPDEVLFMLMQHNLAEIYRQHAHPSKAGIIINYLSLGTNYINYMLKLFISGKMDSAQLVKVCGIIIAREKLMCDKMQKFSNENQFTFNLTSSLDLLGINELHEQYKEYPTTFIEKFFTKVGITMNALMTRDTSDSSAFENNFVDHVIAYLANIENHGNKAHACVWTAINESKDSFYKHIGLTGLSGLNVLDHISQFAVTKLKYSNQNILVALPVGQQKLQLKYDEIFADKFGPLNYLNWLDPILMHDEKYKRKIYFMDAPIDEMNQLIVRVFPLLSSMIAGTALDNPRIVADSLEKLEHLLNNFHIENQPNTQLSKLSHFWHKEAQAREPKIICHGSFNPSLK